jgi:hypothetical protein
MKPAASFFPGTLSYSSPPTICPIHGSASRSRRN